MFGFEASAASDAENESETAKRAIREFFMIDGEMSG